MKCGIYKITNIKTSKVYIGSSENINKRWRQHRTDLNCNRHHSIHLQRSYNKHSKDSFQYEIIEECLIDILLQREQYYKNLYKSYLRKYGYDMCQFAGNCKGVKHSKETILKRTLSINEHWDKVGRPNKDKLKERKENNNAIKKQMKIRDLEIIALLKNNVSQNIIAKQYNLSPSKITNIKQKYGVITSVFAMKGSDNPVSKLIEAQVVEIKKLLFNKTKQTEIADMFKVSKSTIKAIASGQNWSHITIN